jgi:hypothetical protein
VLADVLGPYSLAIAVVVGFVILVLAAKLGRSFSLRWRDMEAKVSGTHDKVESIDRQVNQVAPDDPSLRSMVMAVHGWQIEQRADIALIKRASSEAAAESTKARAVALVAAESTKANNVLLTEHIAACEARDRKAPHGHARHDDEEV